VHILSTSKYRSIGGNESSESTIRFCKYKILRHVESVVRRESRDRPPAVEAPPSDCGPEAAKARRDALSPTERERVERTVSDLLGLLGRAHTMAVLKEFAFAGEPLRFSELEERLGTPPNTLSERLKELTEAGLLTRRAYDEVPPRVEYETTPKARALFPAFGHFYRWAEDHDLDSGVER
jgi:DNA-binding HxlR family transcriptional regulator